MKIEVLEKKAYMKTKDAPLVFVHGAAGGAWYFESFLDYFSNRGYDCCALSLRGHGKSDGYEDLDSYGLDDYVIDVKSIIDKLPVKPILIGHSMGGAIAQRYISIYQNDLLGVVLLASAESGGISEDSPLGLFFNDARNFLRKQKELHPNLDLTLEKIINQTIFSNRFTDEKLKEIKDKLTKESSKVKKDLLKPYMTGFEKINIPVCVIGSYGDHIVTKEKIEKTAKTFNVRPVFIDNCCHFMTIDPEWELAAHAIYKCLDKHKI